MKKETEENTPSSLQNEKDLEERRITFSARLISCLENKKKSFNKKNKSKIRIEQLKEVYIKGACSSDQDLNLHGLARVNMFLRMKEQKMMGVISAKIKTEEKLSGLVLESGNLQNPDESLDISEAWVPQEEDIKQTEADVKEYKLNLDFTNINELYLEPYKPIQFNWE